MKFLKLFFFLISLGITVSSLWSMERNCRYYAPSFGDDRNLEFYVDLGDGEVPEFKIEPKRAEVPLSAQEMHPNPESWDKSLETFKETHFSDFQNFYKDFLHQASQRGKSNDFRFSKEIEIASGVSRNVFHIEGTDSNREGKRHLYLILIENDVEEYIIRTKPFLWNEDSPFICNEDSPFIQTNIYEINETEVNPFEILCECGCQNCPLKNIILDFLEENKESLKEEDDFLLLPGGAIEFYLQMKMSPPISSDSLDFQPHKNHEDLFPTPPPSGLFEAPSSGDGSSRKPVATSSSSWKSMGLSIVVGTLGATLFHFTGGKIIQDKVTAWIAPSGEEETEEEKILMKKGKFWGAVARGISDGAAFVGTSLGSYFLWKGLFS